MVQKNAINISKANIRKVEDVPEELAARIFKDVPTKGFSSASIRKMKAIRLEKYMTAVRRCAKLTVLSAKSRAKAKAKRDAEKKKQKEKERRHQRSIQKRKIRQHKYWLKQKKKNKKIREEKQRKAAALAEREKRKREREKERARVFAKKKRLKKKRRRKRKRKPAYVFPVLRFNYRVALFTNKVMLKWVSRTYKMYKSAVTAVDKLIGENKVEYPRKFILAHHKMSPAQYEYVILEKRCEDDSSLLENELGKFVEHRAEGQHIVEKWVVRGKFDVQFEEDFYVWGYDERRDRKTFRWIMENLVYPICNDDSDLCRLFTFRNKVIIRRDDNSFEIVTCKDSSEAVRLYETIESTAKKEGRDRVVCCGSMDEMSNRRIELEKEIAKKTGWTQRKILNYKVRKNRKVEYGGE